MSADQIVGFVNPIAWSESNKNGLIIRLHVNEGNDQIKNGLFGIDGEPRKGVFAIVLVPVDDNGNIETVRAVSTSKPFGDAAKLLRFDQDGYLPTIRVKEFCQVFGSDDDYQAFCRKQECAKSQREGTISDRVVYAHLRRSNDSGTAFKADYMGIPLLDSIHRDQHQHGEITTLGSKDFMEKARDQYISRWIGSKYKVESLGFVNPKDLVKTFMVAGKLHLIPLAYRKCAE
jgi:hypothetical protein